MGGMGGDTAGHVGTEEQAGRCCVDGQRQRGSLKSWQGREGGCMESHCRQMRVQALEAVTDYM